MREIVSDPEVSKAMAGLIVTGLLVITGLLTIVWKKISGVKDQVVNEHGPGGKDVNLRDQIDRIEQTVQDGFDDVKADGRRFDHQFGEVRKILMQEIEDRQALEKRVSRVEDKL